MRHPARQGLQRRRKLRLRLLPDEPEARPALERDERLSSAGHASPQPDGSYESLCFESSFRWERLRRPAISSRGKDISSKNKARNHPCGGSDRLPPTPPALPDRSQKTSSKTTGSNPRPAAPRPRAPAPPPPHAPAGQGLRTLPPPQPT